jgi:hypothetical protein
MMVLPRGIAHRLRGLSLGLEDRHDIIAGLEDSPVGV